jgi:hypothetical protein
VASAKREPGGEMSAFRRIASGGFVHRSLLLVLIALCVAGCNAEWMKTHDRANTAYSTRPANYRADILAFMRTYLNDPTGIRDAAVSEPEVKTFDSNNRYLSCLRYTARRAAGQSASPRESLVLFLDGRLDRIVDNAREFCKGAAYQPFPELERLTR